MNIKILEKRDFGTYQCFLGRVSLWDYLSAVTKESFEFDIQRGVVKNSALKQSFVRQVKGLDSKYGKNERETFKNIFSIIGSIATKFTGADITPDIKDFCKTYYPVNGNGNCYLEDISDISLAKFIYDTRCSIVHNKESEFHMTYSNCDEYISLIPFMKKVIEIVRDKIAVVINNDNSLIKFLSPQLNLY